MLAFFRPQKAIEYNLTARESEVLTLIAHGYSVRNAAESLQLSHHTVADYLKDIYRKLQVNSRAEATLKAVDLGLITLRHQ
jgi:DNA-binding NarL/FixJ family response regulator